ncbi:MAG: T9SS type A sorting domain-containing protein [Candidatus Lokiarchaeota archaeon]|nr:T9SS type A sorting domain-containing protein [Candidatus Lokiarchaeota archaeon]
MQPGQGYQVYLNAAATLIYPAATAQFAEEDQPAGLSKTQTEHFTFTEGTGDNAVVVITTASNPRYSDGAPLEYGDEIGVFTTEGLCCGAAEWQGENKALTVWGDNNQTADQDGFVAGDTLRFRVWKKSTDTEHIATVAFQAGQPVVYQSNGFSVITDFVADTESTVDVSTSDDMLLPDKHQLLQNYPNPFNPDTHIPYQISRTARVILTIYDLNGRQIRTLINEEQSPGHYTVTWNGTDTSGEKVSSGIYLYRLQVENNVFSHKMILLK